ncbi:MAG: hypothetical protein EOP11_02480 [Proteobacteria bacterium]|nr:MAG: hypothetical protein EOP11_02480 [Pseudomonadota bacterium]
MLIQTVASLLVFTLSAGNYAHAAGPAVDPLAGARFNLVKIQAETELNKLSSGVSVKEALRAAGQRPEDAGFWAKFMAKHKLSPLETIRFNHLRATAKGWEFQVPGLAGSSSLQIDEAAKISLNQKEIDPSLPARELYKAVNSALILKPSAASLFFDALIPKAEANPVVILPALATLGLVAAVQAIAFYTKDAPGEVLEKYFRDAESLCEKERGAKISFDKSETSALREKVIKAGVVSAPAKAGDCEVFAAKFKYEEKNGLVVGNATRACKAADEFLACAEKFREKLKRIEAPKAPEGSAEMNVK